LRSQKHKTYPGSTFRKTIAVLTVILFLFNAGSTAQVVSNNGAYISITASTDVVADTVNTDNSTTVANAGTMRLFTLNNSGTAQGNGTYYIARIFSNAGTFTAGSSLVNFNGNINQNIPGLTFNNLTVSGTGSTKTALGAFTVNAGLDINSGDTINMATYALSGSLTSITGTGTLKTQNTTSTPIPTGKTWIGPIYYNSSSAQTIVLGNYNDLNGTGGNRALSTGTTGIAGTFTVGSGTYTVGTSVLDFNSSGAQTIPAFAYYGINVSGGNTKTLGASFSVADALTLGANTTLALSNYNITLLSGSSSTARIAEVPTTASSPLIRLEFGLLVTGLVVNLYFLRPITYRCAMNLPDP